MYLKSYLLAQSKWQKWWKKHLLNARFLSEFQGLLVIDVKASLPQQFGSTDVVCTKRRQAFGAGRQCAGHCTIALVSSGSFAFRQVAWGQVTVRGTAFRASRKGLWCRIQLARVKMHLMEDLNAWSGQSWVFFCMARFLLPVFHSFLVTPWPKISHLKHPWARSC